MHLRFNDDRATTQVARHHLMAELMLVSRLNTIVLRNKIDDNQCMPMLPTICRSSKPPPWMELAAGSHKKRNTQEPVKTCNCAR